MGRQVASALKIKTGFSLVELVIVIFVLAILVLLVVNYISGSQNRSYYTRSNAEFNTIAGALKLYVAKYNVYPDDVSRSIPAALNEFLAKDAQGNNWPNAPYPNSVYDYENWSIDDGHGNMVPTYQISIRFCPAGGPLTACNFPKETWAKNFGVNSALYYCISGLCRAHSNEPATYPGYCVNCPNNKAIGT